jgi:transposase-like protein
MRVNHEYQRKGALAYLAAYDAHGQVIDVLVPARRDAVAARRFFTRPSRWCRPRW